MRSIPHTAATVAFALALLVPGAPVQAASPPADAPVVHNPSKPSDGEWEVHPVERWRVGGEEDTVVFGAVVDVEVGRDGAVFVLDSQQATVHVIGPDGRYQRRIGRPGSGPGEFTLPTAMCLDGEGHVCVASAMGRRIERLSMSGDPVDACAIPSLDAPQTDAAAPGVANVTMVGDVSFADGAYVLALHATVMGSEGVVVRRQTVRARCDGTILTRYAPTFHETKTIYADIELDEVGSAGPMVTVGPDGRVYVCDSWTDYRIVVLAPDGSVERIVEREFEPIRRSADEKKQIEETMRASLAGYPGHVTVRASDFVRTVGGIIPRDDGSMWVTPAHAPDALPDGVTDVYDEFDRSGRFVRRVFVVLDASRERDGVFPAGDRLIVVRGLSALMKGWVASMQPSAAKMIPDDEDAETDEDGTVIGYAMGPARRRSDR